MITQTFKVTVFRNAVDDKGKLTANVVDPAFSGNVDAPSADIARTLTLMRIFSAKQVNVDGEDATAGVAEIASRYVIEVQLIAPGTGV